MGSFLTWLVALPCPVQEIDRGVAGRSTLGEYERRHAKGSSAIRQRWGRLAGLVLALSEDPQSTRAWERGSTGESKLAQSLAKLKRDDVIVLHDRRVPGSRANIDHIVVCPVGRVRRRRQAVHG